MQNQVQIIDNYPSRGSSKAGLMKRKDPVIYSEDLSKSPVSLEQVESYRKNGFLILDDLFSEKEIEAFQKEAERLKQDDVIKSSEYIITEPTSGAVRSVFYVHQINTMFKNLAADKRLAGLARFILNDEVYIHQSRVNYKSGFEGKEFFWHSDFETWHVEDGMPRMRALSISITLTNNYSYNGPLLLIPGSQNDYVVCEGETPENNFKASLKKQDLGVPSNENLKKLVNKGGIEAATGKAGTVVIFDCNTMHGSNGNISPFPRSNVFLVYNALSNRVIKPFCNQAPRPEFICSRKTITPV